MAFRDPENKQNDASVAEVNSNNRTPSGLNRSTTTDCVIYKYDNNIFTTNQTGNNLYSH